MAVKLRLQRKGRKQAPFYHIVAADSRAPRDGRFIEKIGTYNPLTQPATINLDAETAYEWLMKGAQPTDTVRAILRYKGVMYRKHLLEGVKKGALTVEQAEEKLAAWLNVKDTTVEQAKAKTAEAKKAHYIAVNGKVLPKRVKAAPPAPLADIPDYVAPAVIEQGETAAEAVVETVAAPVVEAVAEVVDVVETPVAEAVEAVAEVVEAPVVEAVAEVVETPVAEAVEAVVEPVAEAVAEVVETPAAEEAAAAEEEKGDA